MYTFEPTNEILDVQTLIDKKINRQVVNLKVKKMKYLGTKVHTPMDRQTSFQTNRQKTTNKHYQFLNNLPTNGSPSKPSLQRQFATWL